MPAPKVVLLQQPALFEKAERNLVNVKLRRQSCALCDQEPPPIPHRSQCLIRRGYPAHFRTQSKRLGAHFGENLRHFAYTARNAHRSKMEDGAFLKTYTSHSRLQPP